MLNFKLDMSVSLLCYEQKTDNNTSDIYEFGPYWVNYGPVVLD